MPNNGETLDALIFIDTNIFLDLYKVSTPDICYQFLGLLDEVKERLVLTNVVEMEYKKNRQRIILKLMDQVDQFVTQIPHLPAMIVESRPVELMKELMEEFEREQGNVKTILKNILANPVNHDRIFVYLEKIFRFESDHILHQKHEKLEEIRKLAWQRFSLGSPPRKSADTAIGDAVNWEWIMYCAEKTGKDIIIVSRDKDFGVIDACGSFLNDWLTQEFEMRTKQQQKIILTDELTHALELIGIIPQLDLYKEESRLVNR